MPVIIDSRKRQIKFIKHAESKIFCPARRGDDAVGHRLLEFRLACPCLLRDREVLFQSGRAPDRHCAADPDQFTGLGVQHLLVVVIEDFLAYFHKFPFR